MATIAMPERLARKHLELPALVAFALVGAAIAFGVFSLDGFAQKGLPTLRVPPPARAEGSAFVHLGEFWMWMFLIAVQTALWAVSAALLLSPEMRHPLREVWPRARAHVAATVGAAGVPLLGVVIFGSVHSTIQYPFQWHQGKVLALSLLGAGVALIGIAEIALVKFALDNDPPVGGSSADVERYLCLRTLLQRILGIEGAIIGAAVLATGGLRNAVVAYDALLVKNKLPVHGTFPREYVLIYGAFFTLILALLYAPVYFKLLEVGRANADAACKPEEPASPAWLPAYEKRRKLDEYLQLQIATSASFRAGVAILAPLGSALVALLLGAA
jgi:hypothetical protein